MALKDTEMHVLSIVGAAIVTAALFVPVLFFTDAAKDDGPQLKEMQVIEASIAYKKSPTKQPQKQTQPTPTIDKPEGVSRDENKKRRPRKKKRRSRNRRRSTRTTHSENSRGRPKMTENRRRSR